MFDSWGTIQRLQSLRKYQACGVCICICLFYFISEITIYVLLFVCVRPSIAVVRVPELRVQRSEKGFAIYIYS